MLHFLLRRLYIFEDGDLILSNYTFEDGDFILSNYIFEDGGYKHPVQL